MLKLICFCTRFIKLLSLSQKDINHYGPIHTETRLLPVQYLYKNVFVVEPEL